VPEAGNDDTGIPEDTLMTDRPEDAITSDAAEALGRLIVAWGSIERELEGLISTIFRVPPVQRPALSVGTPLETKVKLIQAGIALSGPFLEDEEREEFNKKLGELRTLATDTRNFVAHFATFQANDGQVRAGKFGGTKRIRFKTVVLTKEYFDAEKEKTAAMRDEIRKMGIALTAIYDEFDKAWQSQPSRVRAMKAIRERLRSPNG